MRGLNNKTAIVTGAQRGIGRAIALELSKNGATVAVSDLNLEGCEKVCQEIEERGGRALAVECDITKKEQVDELISRTEEEFGEIDILVNNAGVVTLKPFAEMSEEEWNFDIDVNLKGTIRCARAVAPKMVKRKSGKIISIASIAGMVGFANASAYCASKGGIVNLTRELSLELSPQGINVNAVAPGVIETKMTEDMLNDEETKKGLLQNIPQNRIGKPEDIGRAVAFLASEEASYITGHTLVVDGGWLAK